MGNFSRNTFDRLKRYVSVRLQQGVPLIDADWNEMDDIRRSELRTFIKWFIGDGMPANSNGSRNDAFLIAAMPTPTIDNFRILVGSSSSGLGANRSLVDGVEVFITQDIEFKAQPLHEDYTGPNPPVAPDATPVDPNAPKIKRIPTPAGSYLVYLDVWEWEVGRGDDAKLVNPLIGVETCVRIKRDWVVRVRLGTNVPKPGDSDYVTTHSYAPLAIIVRGSSSSTINPSDISDRRQTSLTMSAMEGRLRLLEQLILIPTFAPSPNQFTPKLGPPGTNVTLLGTNFNVSSPVVRFGNTSATIVGTPTNTQIVATVPAMAAGGVRITVQTIGGTVLSDDTFTVTLPPSPTFAPSPNQFTPKLGSPGTTNVTLLGTNFNVPGLTVRFGSTTAAIVSFSATQIVTTVPAMPTGGGTITVQTNGGSVTSIDLFTVT